MDHIYAFAGFMLLFAVLRVLAGAPPDDDGPTAF